MAYLLDSDVLSSSLERDSSTVSRVERLMLDGVSISVFTYYGDDQVAFQTADPEESQRRDALALAGIPMPPVSLPVARRCAKLCHDSSVRGKRVRPRALDLMIAAPPIDHDLILVTRNQSDYRDISGLRID